MNEIQYFDLIAPDWDNLRKTFFTIGIRDILIRESEIKPGITIADIGAGSGYITEGLIDLPVNILAIEQSEGMLNTMQKKFTGYSNVRFIHTNSESMPLLSGTVDIALANMFLHHVSDPGSVIQEIYRIIRKGGKLIISDLVEHTHRFLVDEQYDKWMGFREKDIESWFNSAGFKNIKVTRQGESCSSASATGNEFADIRIFMAKGEKDI